MPLLRAGHITRHTVYWLLFYTALWGLLSGGSGWYIGIPCILGASGLSHWLGGRAITLRLSALPGFLLFFLAALGSGGWDVARRAVQPRMPLSPAWVSYPLSISQPHYRLLFSSMIGLLPGTLASHIEGDLLCMHVLDDGQPWESSARRLEQRLMAVLGEAQP